MENYSFKTAAFGGFDKQDVVRYLEQTAEKSAALQQELEQENDRLRRQSEDLAAQRDRLQSHAEKESAAQESLRRMERDVSRLTAEAGALRPDAEAYARFRMRLGDIECEARNRAQDLEEAAAVRTRRSAETFQSQYRKLMDTFTAAAGHVAQELQTLQEALDRLPRNMDGTEAELDRLMRCLQGGQEERTEYLLNTSDRIPPEEADLEEPLQEEGPDPFRPGEPDA